MRRSGSEEVLKKREPSPLRRREPSPLRRRDNSPAERRVVLKRRSRSRDSGAEVRRSASGGRRVPFGNEREKRSDRVSPGRRSDAQSGSGEKPRDEKSLPLHRESREDSKRSKDGQLQSSVRKLSRSDREDPKKRENKTSEGRVTGKKTVETGAPESEQSDGSVVYEDDEIGVDFENFGASSEDSEQDEEDMFRTAPAASAPGDTSEAHSAPGGADRADRMPSSSRALARIARLPSSGSTGAGASEESEPAQLSEAARQMCAEAVEPPSDAFVLVLVEGDGPTEIRFEGRSNFTIGRSTKADTVVKCMLCSRMQALVTYSAKGPACATQQGAAVYLMDLGSMHGTAVDGQMLQKDEAVVLRGGAEVLFGGCDGVTYHVASDFAARDTAPRSLNAHDGGAAVGDEKGPGDGDAVGWRAACMQQKEWTEGHVVAQQLRAGGQVKIAFNSKESGTLTSIWVERSSARWLEPPAPEMARQRLTLRVPVSPKPTVSSQGKVAVSPSGKDAGAGTPLSPPPVTPERRQRFTPATPKTSERTRQSPVLRSSSAIMGSDLGLEGTTSEEAACATGKRSAGGDAMELPSAKKQAY